MVLAQSSDEFVGKIRRSDEVTDGETKRHAG
jgi:hypothetical protein